MSVPFPDAEESDGPEHADGEVTGPGVNRRRAALAVLPFLALGLLDVALLLVWGIDPLWGFAILPPILFITVIGWVAFKTGFVEGDGRRGRTVPGHPDQNWDGRSGGADERAGGADADAGPGGGGGGDPN